MAKSGTKTHVYYWRWIVDDDLTRALQSFSFSCQHYRLCRPCSSEIQNGVILVRAYPGCRAKWPLNELCSRSNVINTDDVLFTARV